MKEEVKEEVKGEVKEELKEEEDVKTDLTKRKRGVEESEPEMSEDGGEEARSDKEFVPRDVTRLAMGLDDSSASSGEDSDDGESKEQKLTRQLRELRESYTRQRRRYRSAKILCNSIDDERCAMAMRLEEAEAKLQMEVEAREGWMGKCCEAQESYNRVREKYYKLKKEALDDRAEITESLIVQSSATRECLRIAADALNQARDSVIL